jgi:hypothetical protein
MDSCTTVLPLITLNWQISGYLKASFPVAYAHGVPGMLICRGLDAGAAERHLRQHTVSFQIRIPRKETSFWYQHSQPIPLFGTVLQYAT